MVGWLCVRIHVQEKQEQGQGQEHTQKKIKEEKSEAQDASWCTTQCQRPYHPEHTGSRQLP